MTQLTQLKAWTENLHGLPSLFWGSLLHPATATRVLRLARASRRDRADGTAEVAAPLEDTVVEIEKILLDVQKVTIAERKIDADLFWSDTSEGDEYVRLFLRTTEHTIQIGGEETTITLEPRLLLHREGTVQITIGVHLPPGCTPQDVIEASFPGAPLFLTSRVPESYALPGSEWTGGAWEDEPEDGVKVRRLEHEEPASVNEWLEMIVGRVLHGIGAFHGGPWYTYPMILAKAGECCTDWDDAHEQDVAQLAARAVPQRDRGLALEASPDLSTYTDTRTYATAGSALVLHLRPWQPGLLDLYHTLPYERVGLAFVRLRRLEQRIADFRTGKRDVLRSYRSLLQIEKELRGTYYRAGTARYLQARPK